MTEKFAVTDEKEGTVLSLGVMLDAGSATELHQALEKVLGKDDGLILDGGDVERISTASLQLILAASRYCDEHNNVFTLQNPSDTLCQGLTDLGMGDELKRWTA